MLRCRAGLALSLGLATTSAVAQEHSPAASPSLTQKAGKRTAKAAARVKFDPGAPLATYPGFRMLPNGGSQIWVHVSKKVDVKVKKARGRVTYVLQGVNVGVKNNTNPLVTLHFNTPVSQARLLPSRDGALLVLELRENVEPAHQVSAGRGGMMTLQITLPPAKRTYTGTPLLPPTGGAAPVAPGRDSAGPAPSGRAGPNL
jgi:hypothetical protein